MTPANTPAAPNLSRIKARIESAHPAKAFADKWELSLVITQTVSLDGPDFVSRYLGSVVDGFTFNPTVQLDTGTVIDAEASYIGGPHSGLFHLSSITISSFAT
ncbi:hypothetical protein [Halioxenophilus aromaticivorans]|uniref:Uncharacterized protein n=1 Tax=Halioxenophilus aromaticivorans TaxID=1306992 RepID=A0AAV3U1J0_9ALTE